MPVWCALRVCILYTYTYTIHTYLLTILYYFMEVLQSIKLTEFTTAIERQDLYLLEPENNDTNLIRIVFRFNVG